MSRRVSGQARGVMLVVPVTLVTAALVAVPAAPIPYAPNGAGVLVAAPAPYAPTGTGVLAPQRGLHARWRAYPALRPRETPDLTTEVRPRLDLLTPRLLRLLKQTRPARGCRTRMALARRAAETRARLDGLHRDALRLALSPVCGPAEGAKPEIG